MKTWMMCGLAILAAALCGGCGKSEKNTLQASERSITIWWAQWDPADGLQELGNDYQKETGIAIKVHQIPWASYQDQVFLNFGNKQTDFDIVVGDSQWIGRGATKGLYLDLTDWLPTAVDMSTVHPRAAKYLCEYPPGSGKYFAAPCETDAVGFAYRKDWFENQKEKDVFKQAYGRELAPPDTWDEFKEIAEFFTRPDEKRYGCALLTGRAYDTLTMRLAGLVDDPAMQGAALRQVEVQAARPPGGSRIEVRGSLPGIDDRVGRVAQVQHVRLEHARRRGKHEPDIRALRRPLPGHTCFPVRCSVRLGRVAHVAAPQAAAVVGAGRDLDRIEPDGVAGCSLDPECQAKVLSGIFRGTINTQRSTVSDQCFDSPPSYLPSFLSSYLLGFCLPHFFRSSNAIAVFL